MKNSDNFYLQQDEPTKGCLPELKEIILKQDKDISAAWKYGMPFFCYKGKCFVITSNRILGLSKANGTTIRILLLRSGHG